MSRIYLIRHAQASLGSEDYDRLSPLGVRQAQILAEYFETLGVFFDAIYSGAMKRQVDTAKAIVDRNEAFSSVPYEVKSEFNECDAQTIIQEQIPEMLREDPSMQEALANLVNDGRSLKRVFEWAMVRWARGEAHLPTIETWPEFVQRVAAGIAHIIGHHEDEESVAVFTSGGALCVAMHLALGLTPERAICLPLRTLNTGVSLFTREEGELVVSSFNSVAHLELQRDPSLITYR